MDAYCDLLRIAGAVQNAALVLMIAGGVFGLLALRRGSRQAAALLTGVPLLLSVVGQRSRQLQVIQGQRPYCEVNGAWAYIRVHE